MEKSQTMEYKNINNIGILTHRILDDLPWLMNAFSTREGGCSEGPYATMNLSHTVGDDPEKVKENYRIFGEAIGVRPEDMVLAHQTHTDHVMVVSGAHKGMGVTRERDYQDIDGIATDEPGVCLVTSYADCVPLYFVDVRHHAIGLAHSGWRGTVAKIGTRMIGLMREKYGTNPKDLICCIGPCIGKECYEVDEAVEAPFAKAYRRSQYERIIEPKKGHEGKFLLDLPRANYEQFLDCGVAPERIALPEICTSCRHDLLFSHRASHGKRGGMCAFLMIKDKA